MWTFQLLMLSPNLLKSQIPYTAGGGGGGGGGVVENADLPTFDAECKSAKIPNSLCGRGGGGGGGVKSTNLQPLSVLTSCEGLGCTNQTDTKICQPD